MQNKELKDQDHLHETDLSLHEIQKKKLLSENVKLKKNKDTAEEDLIEKKQECFMQNSTINQRDITIGDLQTEKSNTKVMVETMKTNTANSMIEILKGLQNSGVSEDLLQEA